MAYLLDSVLQAFLDEKVHSLAFVVVDDLKCFAADSTLPKHHVQLRALASETSESAERLESAYSRSALDCSTDHFVAKGQTVEFEGERLTELMEHEHLQHWSRGNLD